MKKIAIFYIFSIASCLSYAQQVLACQFTQSTGFTWKSGRWASAGFLPNKPFFLRINDDELIEPKSLESLLFFPADTVCKKFNSKQGGLRTACAEADSGSGVVLNLQTLTGAASLISGAATQIQNMRDDVLVSLFTCQRM